MALKNETPDAPANADAPASPAVTPAPTVTADELAAPLAEAMPAPSTSPAPEELENKPVGAAAVPKDSKGVSFDPAKHKAAANGTPMVNKNGEYYPKHLGRAPDATKKANPPPRPTFAGQATQPTGEARRIDPTLEDLPPGEDQYTMQAEVFLQMGYGPIVALFTADAKPDPDQHLALKQSLGAWLRVKKLKDIPPGAAFALCAIGVFMSKLEKPTVRERAAMVYLRAKQIWARWTGGDKPEGPQ